MDKIQQLWSAFLDFSSKLVIPDWGALVALMPIGVLAFIVLSTVLIVRAYAMAGPRERGLAAVGPLPPSGVHAASPSFAPIFAAVGAGVLFFGLVFGGLALFLGVAALILTLLYWLREGMRDYEHVAGASTLPVVVEHGGPPPGVHVPGPTFLPFTSAVGAAILFFGLVFGGWLLAAGVICFVIGLLGWMSAARAEYRLTLEADQTGHMRNAPAPGLPLRTYALFTVILLAAAIVQAGILPPRGSATGVAGASPGASGPAAPAPGGGSGPPAPAADVTISAQNTAFTATSVSGPANKPFTIAFQNQDAGIPHNVDIKKPDGSDAFKGEIVTGVTTKVYNVPSLPPGDYPFQCTVHPTMTGTLSLK
jgi:plastocyanin